MFKYKVKAIGIGFWTYYPLSFVIQSNFNKDENEESYEKVRDKIRRSILRRGFVSFKIQKIEKI